ncbi:hypothetical protein [Aureispira anguillae]|uniref:Uncharacterized protein n=1 Tax=Aureispira anguillae TaxID=2864201 RepID=A0A915YJ93_9BACT|nr:hypothetical protein [Aureispira anguillae]BDS13966.1 hypothetical protein AsAng_0047290 [Aureispira anguillae]
MKLHLRCILPFLLFLITLLMVGCGKEDVFKNPTAVLFDITMDPSGAGASDNLTLNNGYIILSSFSVIGERDQAENFEFSRSFPNGLKIPFYSQTTFDDLSFELPQGDYSRLVVRFETVRTAANEASLFVEGGYKYRNPNKVPSAVAVHVKWSKIQQFEVDVTTALGNNKLTLSEDKVERPYIVLTPKSWFANVSELMLNNASFIGVGGVQTIIIDENMNHTLFNEVDALVRTNLKCTL